MFFNPIPTNSEFGYITSSDVASVPAPNSRYVVLFAVTFTTNFLDVLKLLINLGTSDEY